MTTAEAIRILRIHNEWRTGRDERTFDELGITAIEISGALEHAIEVMEGSRK